MIGRLPNHCFPLSNIIPNHNNNRSNNFCHHIINMNLFNKKPHQNLIDEQANDTGSDEQYNGFGVVLFNTFKHPENTHKIIYNNRDSEADT